MAQNARPLVGISVGDPGGIGPEITAKSLSDPDVYELCRPLAVADARFMRDAVAFSKLDLKVHPITAPEEGLYTFGTIDVLDMANMPPEQLRYKTVTTAQGKASYEYIAKNIALAMTGAIDATVTGPINKAAINAADYHFAGHTEIYAHLTNTRNYTMMLADGNFRVTHVSTHVSLREACDRVKKDRVLAVIKLTADTVAKMGIGSPRIAVAGLNPHCGEGGLFGTEDDLEISPAIVEACAQGIDVQGPLPADTVFSKMLGGQFDAVVCMYHDQGHIPTKLNGFRFNETTNQWDAVAGVNITLGLPIIRVSVDHGTAFGKAGEGRANPESMLDSIRLAAKLAQHA